jgi:L-ascorbate metabolism protein UlaG (beta-lactamase superfamily)
MNDAFSRGDFLQVTAATGAASTLGNVTAATGRSGPLKMRWYGGGVYELATPDDKAIVLVDAWIWNNTGFKGFNIEKPAELSSAAAYAAHIKKRAPEAFVVALTHDHGDHMGDYFELLGALVAAGVDVKTVGQSDLMRVALVPKFKAANLEYEKLVLNGGAGINMGGVATHKGVKLELVPAVHSTAAGYPAAGFIIDIGGVRVYASGDTDVYGDMALVGSRYKPELAIVSSGNGAFTMGPDDAALAVKLVGAAHAVPVHYAHNPLVLGPQCGEMFAAAVARVAPSTRVTVLKPGTTTTLQIAARSVSG